MSTETTNQSDSTNQMTNDDRETIPNPERGCGTLDNGKAYLRADVGVNGELPAFVEFDQPIPFKEDRKRSYKMFPGIQFELSVTGEAGLTKTSPVGEVFEHIDRLISDRPTGTTAGEMVSFHSHDLLMSVGKTHYETAQDFADEAKVHGVNKAISVTSGNEPPVVNPGRTRLFLIHPRAVETVVETTEEVEVEKTEAVELENGETTTVTYTETEERPTEETRYLPGVFGYTYLTRVIYTEDVDGNVPKYIQDYESTGSLDVVRPGKKIPYSKQEGFDADGNVVDARQTTLDTEAVMEGLDEAADEIEKFASEYRPVGSQFPLGSDQPPALEAPTVEKMEKADLGKLSESDSVDGSLPPEGEDLMAGDEEGALAVVQIDNQMFKVMPSNNLSIEEGIATSVVGPYRLTVADSGDSRTVSVENTR